MTQTCHQPSHLSQSPSPWEQGRPGEQHCHVVSGAVLAGSHLAELLGVVATRVVAVDVVAGVVVAGVVVAELAVQQSMKPLSSPQLSTPQVRPGPQSSGESQSPWGGGAPQVGSDCSTNFRFIRLRRLRRFRRFTCPSKRHFLLGLQQSQEKEPRLHRLGGVGAVAGPRRRAAKLSGQIGKLGKHFKSFKNFLKSKTKVITL